MNKIYKIVKDNKGQQVAVSELAKGARKGAGLVFMACSFLVMDPAKANNAVTVLGVATGDQAIAIGHDSFASSISGIAEGHGAIATGQGLSREEFSRKKKENQQAFEHVKNQQNEIANKQNQLGVINHAIDGLNNQIQYLENQQNQIRQKIEQKEQLNHQRDLLSSQVNQADTDLNQAKSNLEKIQKNGKNVYLNFTDVLRDLNWESLNGSGDGRQTIARELRQKIEHDFADFTNRYTDQQYQDIIQGYLNRQGGYQGTLEYLLNNTSDHSIAFFAQGYDKRSLFQNKYFNSSLDDSSYALTDDYTKMVAYSEEEIHRSAKSSVSGYLSDSEERSTLGSVNGFEGNFGRFIEKSGGQSGLGFGYSFHALRQEHDRQAVYNSTLLLKNALKKSKENKVFTAIMSNARSIGVLPEINIEGFSQRYNEGLIRRFHNGAIIWGIKTKDGNKVHVGGYKDTHENELSVYDRSIGILTKFQDYSVNNDHLISTDDIENFRNFLNDLKQTRENIDWDFNESVVDLADYRTQYDKVIQFNEEINDTLKIYEAIIEERQKTDGNQQLIEQKTKELIFKKAEILGKTSDLSNFIAGIKPIYKPEIMKQYINYAKAETDSMIERINRELRLYSDKDQIIADTTKKAKEIQQAYDNAKKNRDEKQAELDRLNQEIANLALTPEEEANDSLKSQKEQEKAQKEQEKLALEKELLKDQEELDRLKQALADSSLKNLGERSYAQGYLAFASGNDSIAIGTNATVTANNGIVVGKDSQVTGVNSITVGNTNTVSGGDNFVAGNNNTVKSNQVVAIGNDIVVETGFNGAVILGHESVATVANPTEKIQIRNVEHTFAGTNPTATVSIGAPNKERQLVNVAAGRVSESSTDAVNGSQLYAVVDTVNKLKAESDNTKLNAGNGINITLATPPDAEGSYTISLSEETKNLLTREESVAGVGNIKVTRSKTNQTGGQEFEVSLNSNLDGIDSVGKGNKNFSFTDAAISANGNKIINIAAPTENQDAANKKYVDDTNTKVISEDASVTIKQTTDDKGAKVYNLSISDSIARTEHIQAIHEKIDWQVDILDSRISQLDNLTKSGIAGANAAAALPQIVHSGQSMLSVATGGYEGKMALAVGYSRMSDNGRMVFKSHINANNDKKVGYGVGVGMSW